MIENVSVNSPVVVIKSGNPPTVDNLNEGEIAYGNVVEATGNHTKVYYRIGNTVHSSYIRPRTLSFTLYSSGWSQDGNGKWLFVFTSSSVQSDWVVLLRPSRADRETALAAQINEAVDVAAGSIKVYANNKPAVDIDVTVIII
jgi:hypothetical protein